MQVTWIAALIALLPIAVPHASAAGGWYWCASSHAFFPYVQSCSIAWQEVPVGTPMESLMPKPAPAIAKPAPVPATNPPPLHKLGSSPPTATERISRRSKPMLAKRQFGIG